MTSLSEPTSGRASTGVAGLDEILFGGFARDRIYLLEGNPGTGKTTAALQFLLAGLRTGERGLYITLSETDHELRESARSHGWSLEGLDIFEVVPPESLLDADQQQSLLYSSDLELGETTKLVFEAIERLRPARVVFDSLSEIRLLAQSSLRYRRQVLAFKHYFARRGITVLLLDDLTAEAHDRTVHSIAHAVIRLEEMAPEYGAQRRRLRVIKYRGSDFCGGYHDFKLAHGGLKVFPRLVAAGNQRGYVRERATSTIAELNQLLGGGIERGSSTVLIGPAGTGKSLLSLQFAVAAVDRGESAAVFVFDEEVGLLVDSAKGLGIDLDARSRLGRLRLVQVDPADVTPGEFAHKVKECAEAGVGTIVIDSLNGYQAAMPEERFLLAHMHELLQYLNRQGASTFLTVAQHGLVGDMRSPFDVTYLADSVILLRYFEAQGRIRRAVSVIKKRAGTHEDTIREFQISDTGIKIGPPLTQFQGVLTGVPVFCGPAESIMPNNPE